MPLEKEYCPQSMYMILSRETPAGIVIKGFRSQCNTWKCPVCSKRNVLRLKNRMTHFFHEKTIYHYTLTIKMYGQHINTASHHIKKSFDRFRKRVCRRYGYFAYVYFVEFGKNNNLHYHLLSTLLIENSFLNKHWFQSTRNSTHSYKSPRPIKHSTLENYITKYVSKEAIKNGGSTIGGYRLYGYSNHFYNPFVKYVKWSLHDRYAQENNYGDGLYNFLEGFLCEFSLIRGRPPNVHCQNFEAQEGDRITKGLFSDCLISFL